MDKFIFNEKSASFLVGRVYEEKESSFYIIPGVSLKRVLKNKKVSGFYTSIGIGGGQEILKGDNYLYNSRTAWCNSIDVGYIIGFKHFYLKPFVGLLSIFNFKEFIDYNNGEVISTGKLNYYSQNNPEKTNLYKSSTSPNPAQILIKYKYAGLTNATFLPRGLFSIGFTF
ncbi:MAG: hypothetical protein HYX39_07435 [Bacteroidetes bacterium]|nr:hypothetical protein [Bacteroidota bacterium]